MSDVQQIANLEITITDNATGAAEKVRDFASALTVLKNASSGKGLQRVADNITAINGADFSGFGRLQQALNSALRPAQQLADALERVKKATGKSLSSSISTVKKTSEGLQEKANAAIQGNITSRSDVTADIEQATTGIREVHKNIDNATGSAERFKNALTAVGGAGKNVLQTIIPSGLRNIISQFGRLMKMKVMRTIISNLLKGFSEGLQNVYYWAKATGDGFANSMDTITTSLNYAKNSIGAAFSTLLNQIAPIIDSIIDWLVQGINYVNMFFAVLSGSDTYTRAKKVAVEYGNAAAGAIGGATGAAKELKAELSTLAFDELNQLQEQATGGGGSGGGGGAGGTGSNYADMFEKAQVEQNWLTKTAGWLRDNFADVLDYVKAIGAGILAWKVTNAFSNVLNALTGGKWTMTRTLGISLMVGGAVLSYEGGYDLGKNGFKDENGLNLSGIIKSALGVTATAVGGALAFGPAGAVIGLAVGIGLNIYGYIKGINEKFAEELENNPDWIKVKQKLQASQEALEITRSIRVHINEVELDYQDKISNADAAQLLLDKIGLLNGIDATASNIAEIQRLTASLNSTGVLGDLSASWDVVNGKIVANCVGLQNAIDLYRQMAKDALIYEYTVAQAKADVRMNAAMNNLTGAQADYDEYLAIVKQYIQDNNLQNMVSSALGGNRTFAWKPGQEVSAGSAGGNQELYEMMKQLEGYYETMGNYSTEVGEAYNDIKYYGDQLAVLTGAVEENTSAINASTKALGGSSFKTNMLTAKVQNSGVNVAGGKAQISGTTGRFTTPQSMKIEADLEQQKKWNDVAKESWKEIQNGVNIYADYTKNTNYQKKAQSNATAETKKATIEVNKYNSTNAGTVKTLNDSHYAWKQNQADLNGFKSGMTTATTSTNTFGTSTQTMAKTAGSAMTGFSTITTNVVSNIIKSLNGMGAKVNPSAVMAAIRKAFVNSANNTNWSGIGKAVADGITAQIKANLNKTGTSKVTTVIGSSQASVNMTWKIQPYAKGGMNIDAGTLMLAGEHGAEAVGTINGRTGVANRDQIADAIAKALTPMLGNNNNRQETTNIDLYLDSQIVARASARGQKAMQKQFNLTARA